MLNDDLQVVMKLDAKLSSHPIVQPVNHPDEITEIFDTISYSKVSSVAIYISASLALFDDLQVGWISISS